MSLVVAYGGACICFKRTRVLTTRAVKSTDLGAKSIQAGTTPRLQILQKVDEELRKGNEREALYLVRDSQGKPDGLHCFGSARQVPQRLYSLDELKLNQIDTSSFLSPVDATLGSIERYLQLAGILGGISAWSIFGFSQQQIFYISVGLLFLWSLDLISFDGGIRNLVLDTIGHNLSQKYHDRVTQHEAGHFLIAYLLGVLPKGYTLSSLEALTKEGSLNVQAGTAFVDFEFVEEIGTGKVSAKVRTLHPLKIHMMLNKFSCIALAGVATEYLIYGYSEGGLADIDKLDKLLKGLGFTQKKADSQVRWAVLNTVLILRRHERTRSLLAQAMASGKSVGCCIEVIEKDIDAEDV
ncbi:uncharacterized protein M6B38_274465 [Iris pallida]|uniref:Stress regulated protein n=1 Tax=Iris pallida TaxID=29817 RepID=A0AAX6I5Z1_IRIPA|nr:uncharacterized protein M6B38_274465 [Iris pallida]